ncbi:hypothetical protein [Allochromatium vinosum]|uniref:Uncharacterized protein n=1 Tax=Allochromatium vinosum (strain ATCC 17899 / DSM 180 / NBRC 103801 / NCIMB 10441 / D) TaxID=572477 RepID=D3RTY0_ALLVD|nr:hypothetical protein [Allochromatium vinosum]ADC62639.1 conserved hypothetical protein [Allochromatium vinosum DSM 180]
MTLTLVAPSPEAAIALARRLYPDRCLVGEPVAVSPAGPEDARRFTETVKTLTPVRRTPHSWSLQATRHATPSMNRSHS